MSLNFFIILLLLGFIFAITVLKFCNIRVLPIIVLLLLLSIDIGLFYYALSYTIIITLTINSLCNFNHIIMFLILFSFLLTGLVLFYLTFRKYLLFYNFFYGIGVVLEEDLGERYVIRYFGLSDKISGKTNCFGPGDGALNFSYKGEFSFEDFMKFLSNISNKYFYVEGNVARALYRFSVSLYREIVKAKGPKFISYSNFLPVFILYINSVFYDCFVNSGIYFSRAKFNFTVQFWLDNLSSDGKFLESFIEQISKSSDTFTRMSFNFLFEVYDPENPLHVSSTPVDYSVLYLDLKVMEKDSESYFYKACRFVSDSNFSLKRSQGLSDQDWSVICKYCRDKKTPMYKVFFKNNRNF